MRTTLAALCFSTLALLARDPSRVAVPGTSVTLHEGWSIQAAAQVKAGGAEISQAGFAVASWYPARVPNTVLGALMDDGVYSDSFVGKNLVGIQKEPFQGSWWYRTEFNSGKTRDGVYTRLQFDGLNYRANIWLNGRQIAGKDAVFGVWRVFDFDVTPALKDGVNALAVEVFPPEPLDFAMGFADWNPKPADGNMGLFREVKLRRSGSVSLENVFVRTRVDLDTFKAADLTITADLVNHASAAQAGTVNGEIGSIRFSSDWSLAPGEKKTIRFSPENAPALHIQNPRLWWPVHLGEPNLYTLKLTATAGKTLSDQRSVTFGIREVGDYLTPQGHRGYTVNGKKVLIRGGGWTDEIFLREDPAKLESQLRYVLQMNLNTIRMEGFWGSSQTIYDLADRYGLLIMNGFSCQWEWDHYKGKPADTEEYGAAKLAADVTLQASYLRDQVTALRNHPSVLVWVVGSDKLPWPEVESIYRDDLKGLDPTRPYLSSCKTWKSTVSGTSGVKMLGPYNYVTPNFWFVDKVNGGAYGFNTETGPGPEVPPLASLKKMIPAGKLWPINDYWNFHCALGDYSKLDHFMNAYDHRYGPAQNVEEFAFKVQAANYEGLRAMYSAFGSNKPASTGIVQWMLNSAWPKMFWQLYDFYLMPGGAFYGTRKGSQPLNLVYDYGDHGVHLVNDTLSELDGAVADVTLLDLDSKVVYEQSQHVALAGGLAKRVLDLPALTDKSPVYFLDLKLRDSRGTVVSDNFYWLSPKEDGLDPSKYTQFAMPNTSFADFTALGRLPAATVKVAKSCVSGKQPECRVTLTNTSDRMAFFLDLEVVGDRSGEPVLPVFWDDDYVSLLPHESKTLTAKFSSADLKGEKPRLTLKGWNVQEIF
jgi:exo-1,4-beta-D-glucosaminidase